MLHPSRDVEKDAMGQMPYVPCLKQECDVGVSFDLSGGLLWL